MRRAVPLFERLPEIYRTRDAEQSPPDQLRAYLGAIEAPFSALHDEHRAALRRPVHRHLRRLGHPVPRRPARHQHLKGDPRTLRADVADTIALRRRKGTLGAIERLAVNLTGWACRAVELRENLGVDAAPEPPAARRRRRAALRRTRPDTIRRAARRHGAAARPGRAGAAGHALRPLRLHRGRASPPRARLAMRATSTCRTWRSSSGGWRPTGWRARGRWRKAAVDLGALPVGQAHDSRCASTCIRWTCRCGCSTPAGPASCRPARSGGVISPLTEADAVPGPMPDARLNSGTPDGQPQGLCAGRLLRCAGRAADGLRPRRRRPAAVHAANAAAVARAPGTGERMALALPRRQPVRLGKRSAPAAAARRDRHRFGHRPHRSSAWTPPRRRDELVVPDGAGVRSRLFASFTYGAAGPVGAHPVSRGLPLDAPTVLPLRVGEVTGGITLQAALAGLDTAADAGGHRDPRQPGAPGRPGRTRRHRRRRHHLAAAGAVADDPRCRRTPADRAAGAAAVDAAGVAAAATPEQPRVRLEGLYLATDGDAGFPAGAALIDRAAVARLEIIGCTLAPGGHSQRDGSRAPLQPALHLVNGYGFAAPATKTLSCRRPTSCIQRSITGSAGGRWALSPGHPATASSTPAWACATRRAACSPSAPPPTRRRATPRRSTSTALSCFGPVRVAAVGGLGRHLHAALRGAGQPARLHQMELPSAATPTGCRRTTSACLRRRCAHRLHVRTLQRPGLRPARA